MVGTVIGLVAVVVGWAGVLAQALPGRAQLDNLAGEVVLFGLPISIVTIALGGLVWMLGSNAQNNQGMRAGRGGIWAGVGGGILVAAAATIGGWASAFGGGI